MLEKNTFFIFFFSLFSFISQGQITLENEYDADISTVLLESVGTKYISYNRMTNQVKLYNLDHSIYKTITIPVNSLYNTSLYSTTAHSYVFYVKEGLFDTDSEIEFMFYYRAEKSGSPNINGTAIINEDGTLIFDRKNAFPGGYINNFGTRKGIQAIVKGSNNTTKMILQSTPAVPIDSTFIYNLPGTLMCDPCGGITGARSTERQEQIVLDQNIPNPSTTYTVIGYELPEETTTATLKIYNTTGIELKSYDIDKTFDHLQVSTEDLPAGTYFYSINTSKGQVQSKKMIVVK